MNETTNCLNYLACEISGGKYGNLDIIMHRKLFQLHFFLLSFKFNFFIVFSDISVFHIFIMHFRLQLMEQEFFFSSEQSQLTAYR